MVGREAVMDAVRLARLDLAPDELDRILSQVEAILSHIEELEAVQVADAPALGGIAESDAPVRADVHDPDALVTPPSALAPDWAEGFFALPRLAAMDTKREAKA